MPEKTSLTAPPDNAAASAIQSLLGATIAANGPISVSQFMEIVLSHPQHGYYRRQDPLGMAGDFTTAAEISGLFGEICGLYLAHMFDHAGQPADAAIVELGPGRGTLMADMRHAWSQAMPVLTGLPVHLVETSPALRQRQKQTITNSSPIWHDDVPSLPKTALFGIANEFFDALPVQQAVARSGRWHHRLIDIRFGELVFVDGPPLTGDEQQAWRIVDPHNVVPDGHITEHCPAAISIALQIATRIAQHGGAFLVIDYGQNGNQGDSLQAVAAHRPVDLFYQPGTADLSHWVDFAALKQATEGAGGRFIGPVTQGHFLMSVGLRERAENAALQCDAEGRRAMFAAVERLVGGHHMGAAFKVGLILPAGRGTPIGFTGDKT
jgi:NADH dehydrogenase [ubiquinone] 1 alpha subcomplex assembly factor 7